MSIIVKNIVEQTVAEFRELGLTDVDVESVLDRVIEQGGMTVEEAQSDLGWSMVANMIKEIPNE